MQIQLSSFRGARPLSIPFLFQFFFLAPAAVIYRFLDHKQIETQGLGLVVKDLRLGVEPTSRLRLGLTAQVNVVSAPPPLHMLHTIQVLPC